MKELTIALLIALPAITPSATASIIISWNPPPYTYTLDWFFTEPKTLAYDFVIGSSSLSVIHLGVADSQADGLVQDHAVGIWSEAGYLVAGATIPRGDTAELIGGFRYVNLSEPAVLAAGQRYVIGAWYHDPSDGPYSYSSWDPTGYANFASMGANYAFVSSTTLTFPGEMEGVGPVWGGSFQYEVVPEPSTLALFLVGAASVGFISRLRKRRDRVVTKRFDIPLSANPSVSVIVLRKGVDEISIGETVLYLDQDRDGLDAGQEALLQTSDTTIDSDGDGLNDKAEVDAGADPVDPASFLAGLCGVVSYAGQETGAVFIVVNNSTNLWPAERFATVSGPGAYCISNFLTLTNYWIHTFLDWNQNGAYDSWEPAGSYSLNPLYLTGNTLDIDITLLDPPDTDTDGLPDPWELYWFGSATGAVATADEEPDGTKRGQSYE